MKVLVSSCLLGIPVRYNGQAYPIHPILKHWQDLEFVMPFCPETAAGLPTPRPAAEILGGNAQAVFSTQSYIQTQAGEDITQAFISGAQQTLKICQDHNIQVAVLTEKSPSCGSTQVYDGSFSSNLVLGVGVTTYLLRQQGIHVFNQNNLDKAEIHLHTQDSSYRFYSA